MKIGFDFDGTLSDEAFGNFIKIIAPSLNKHNLVLITSRGKVGDDIVERVENLGLDIKQFFAMGNTIHFTKADFVEDSGMSLDLFFDNDPYEVEAFRKRGILCLFIPPEAGSLMEEIVEGFMKEKVQENEDFDRDLNILSISDERFRRRHCRIAAERSKELEMDS